MSRRIILIIIGILIIALGIWVYTSSTTPTTPGGTTPSKSILSSLFPFGSTAPTTQVPQTGTAPTAPAPAETTPATSTPEALMKLSSRAVAGLTVFIPVATTPIMEHSINDDTGTASAVALAQLPIVRYAERGTGYIYDVDARGNNANKVSGTIIARTAVAQFADNGQSAILRLIKDDNRTVSTFLGHITPTVGDVTGELKGNFLPDNIVDVAVSPDGKSLAYVAPTGDGVVGMSMKTDGVAKKQLFISAFGEWLIDWTGAGIMATTKASSDIPGYAYLVSSNGVFQKMLGGTNGLTTKPSPDGKMLLYGIGAGKTMALHLDMLKDGTDLNLGLTTLPEKCVWKGDDTAIYCAAPAAFPDGDYPDSWYQGISHFSDALWKIDTATGTTTQVSNGGGNFLDATDLTLDPSGKYLFFVSKNDGSLWSLDLSAAAH